MVEAVGETEAEFGAAEGVAGFVVAVGGVVGGGGGADRGEQLVGAVVAVADGPPGGPDFIGPPVPGVELIGDGEQVGGSEAVDEIRHADEGIVHEGGEDVIGIADGGFGLLVFHLGLLMAYIKSALQPPQQVIRRVWNRHRVHVNNKVSCVKI